MLMKSRFLVSLLLLLLAAYPCSATITSATVWDVRPTTGSNLNGACFDSTIANAGTDYSQQATAQLSLSDMATTGVTTTVTSVTGGFTAAMIGNCLRIDSGTNWTLGWYQITARTDTNTITVDRAPTSAAGVSGTGKVGGSTKSINGQATTTLNTSTAMQAGNTIYVKNEAWNEAVVLSGAGTLILPRILEGYNTTHGDAPTGSNRPHNNRAAAGTQALNISGAYWQFKHLWISNAGTRGFDNSTTSGALLVNVRSSTNGTIGFDIGGQTSLVNCEADTNTQTGVTITATPALVYASYIHGNTTNGIDSGGFAPTIIGNIITANAANGINNPGSYTIIIGNTINGNTGATTDGIGNGNSNTTGGTVVMNNILANNGRDGARWGASAAAAWFDYNDYYLNAGVPRTSVPTGASDVTTNPTFTNSGSGDFSIGTPLRNLGFPGTFPASTSIGHMDIGAVQSGQGAITQGACHRTVQ